MGNGSWRIIAQRVLTGEFLSWDVPLGGATTSRALSGPGGVFGKIDRELFNAVADDGLPLFDEWSTALYAEEQGQIKAGGIISKIIDLGTTRTVEASGFAAYPRGIPYAANYLPNDFPDPTDVFKHVWEYVQDFPNGNLGVTVNSPETWMVLTNGSGPFTMRDFEYRDCGDTLDQLAQATPFDFLEQHSWGDDDHTVIDHRIEVAFPRLGRKRDDLRFADGENVVEFTHIEPRGDQYANDVYVYGRGQGSAMQRARSTAIDGRRLRRCAVVSLSAHGDTGYLKKRAAEERAARNLNVDIPELRVKDHPNARITAINPGDDILFEADLPWRGYVRTWLRVLSVDEVGEFPGQAVLKTQRSDTFTYAAGKSPNGEKVPVQM